MSSNELLVGDPAPALRVREFLKGEPIAGFAPGTIHVVEFWATWCGPCMTSIPHLTALQAAYPGIRVVGVDVLENEVEAVRAFVSDQGDAMGYTVAMDASPEAGDGAGPTFRAWCESAYEQGIPSAFIVDGEGVIAWIGHPMSIDDPLAAVVAGRWDRAAAAEAHRDRLAADQVRETHRLHQAVGACGTDSGRALRVVDEFFERYPELGARQWSVKLALMLRAGHADALGYAHGLLAAPSEERASRLLRIGTALAGHLATAAADGRPVEPVMVSAALDMLGQFEATQSAEQPAFVMVRVRESRAAVCLAAGQTRDALAHARSARDLAEAADLEPRMLEHLDGLVERCAKAAAPAAKPDVVCEDGVCRLVVPARN